jgi:hypothetical protein
MHCGGIPYFRKQFGKIRYPVFVAGGILGISRMGPSILYEIVNVVFGYVEVAAEAGD